ncbi:Glycine betaine-binding protein OpuAC precursor [Marinomonas spartinae]|uniref:Glycine betaine-binding protein OpuAC n=1 Tax=Marinomonas spartinae TaxID=1792290 RepID=A0A1A8T787_9GAMM|nr:ABC transporter substrate-binding protein [Marinomonas spartinae]SBS28186.1 Glycine betaine-binding protein OpuAC precursor [Marinomonas spartinae]SBS28390.1 Glycine betaine-binding protein OpuAC precursor [Marinomonas spartinae]
MYKKALLAGLMTLATTSVFAANNQCGKVTIANMNWNSATLMANVDKFILNHGYGCHAELVPGDTMPTGTSMIEKGEPDIAPEMWTNSMKDAIDRGVKEGRLKIAAKSLSDGGEEGFWVPKYMVDKDPSLATIQGVIKHAKDFPNPQDSSVSAFYGCPPGWNCQISAQNLFNALHLKKAGFVLVNPGSGAGLAGTLAHAYEKKAPWFGYYWAPTAILGKYQMVKVDFGTGVNKKEFTTCITQANCLDPKPTMYPPSPVYTLTTAKFEKRSPEAFAYLQHRSYTNKQMNSLLAWMEDNQADGQYAAEEFMLKHKDIWSKWVSKKVAAKLDTALNNL